VFVSEKKPFIEHTVGVGLLIVVTIIHLSDNLSLSNGFFGADKKT
jgi:hypothetical protein